MSNKVSFIRNSTDVKNWHYVPSADNPADLISRGANVGALFRSSLWSEGPRFLAGDTIPVETCQEIMARDEEMPEAACHACAVDVSTPLHVLMHSRSSWYKLKVRLAWLLKSRDALHNDTGLKKEKLLLVI